MQPIRVAIVDDHPIVRRGLTAIIGGAGDMHVVVEADDGAQALRLLKAQPVDVLLLDLTLPTLGGLDVLAALKRSVPDVRAIVLSAQPEERYALPTLKAGAKGYLSKTARPEQILAAIRSVARGGKYVTREVAQLLGTSRADGQSRAPHLSLSGREYQVFALLASGMTVSEVAQQMGLSVKTVSTYRVRILQKLSLRTTAQLLRYAVTHSLID